MMTARWLQALAYRQRCKGVEAINSPCASRVRVGDSSDSDSKTAAQGTRPAVAHARMRHPCYR